ncbi:peptidase S24 [Chryseobacterium rhizoplanae]|uniref:peptidase S24 n=1 Tax=Chryseobacterium rhizoplanae TaxID=1609531 RepID=UPI001CE23AE3|nr:peptidase S24 [Chryseobacterium rhizoplanae]UCA61694.1 peptidase S24 [Chryseobacterium rhizoplanae]
MLLPIENQRIKDLINYFCDGNELQFSREIGISQPRINRLFSTDPRSGKYPIVSFEIIQSIINKFIDVNSEWLIIGKGEMLKKCMSGLQKDFKKNIAETYEHKLIPLYNGVIKTTQAEAGVTLAEPVEFIDAGDWFRDATAAMKIHDNSMPKYSGGIAILKEVNDKSLLIYGQDYVIETSEYRVLKRIQKGSEKDTLLLCSNNTEKWDDGSGESHLIHEPFEINVSEIQRLFLALGYVKRNHIISLHKKK